MSPPKEAMHSDWGSLDARGVEAIERAIGRSIASGLEEFMTDPERVGRVMATIVDVAAARGAEESGRWLWRKIAGLAWSASKALAIAAMLLYVGGGWPAVLAFLKFKGSGA
jgi:hypothetical protein